MVNHLTTNMNYNTYKIQKCLHRGCKTCNFIKEDILFMCTNTHQVFWPILNTEPFLSCTTRGVIYLMSCKLCGLQYVGETKNSTQKRFNGHRSSIRRNKSNQLVHQHFNEACHGLDNITIQPIKFINLPNATQREKDKFRLEREKCWISVLQTIYPLGLNERLKGVGDFHPS